MLYAGRFVTRNLVRPFTTAPFVERTKALLAEAALQAKKTEEVSKAWLLKENDEKLPKAGVYKHPYCTEEFPISIHGDYLYRIILKTVGPEPVSPHFDSIEEFGKWFNYFFLFLGFCIVMRSHQNHAFGFVVFNMMFGLEIWLYTLAIYFMRGTAMIVPNPWKHIWMEYNMNQMISATWENEENGAFEKKKESVSQADYMRIHNEYIGTKTFLLEKHLQTSRLLLKKHTYERTIAALRAADRFEKDNAEKLLRDMLDSAVVKMEKDLEADKGEIKKQAFQAALQGIRQGKMSYEGDPLLPRVLKYVDEFKAKAEKFSPEVVAELVGLKADQKEVLKSNDKKAEEYFLKTLPPIKHPKVLESSKFKSLSA
ncbi:unnamed protein product [Blepharisma stoltei]|uniref:Uncharacterized protein n=1 Tax=Blepharisma stoltei TaxID=1481888 RepID=A0AAU9JCP8_9CILI|nr:unnamed protein product [Blepharisma stoltei]